MISIVIPAHNEEAVIGRSLRALLSPSAEGLDVVVVCNGCRDGTAEAARRVGRGVRVIETEVASKSNALNLGDAATTTFPRFYLDADVQISGDALRRLAAELRSGECLAVAPRFRMNLDGSSGFVRAFYAINDLLPTSREGIGGSGVYGLSEAGRRRFGEFPKLTADDGFVRVQFRPEERRTVDDCFSTVFAPRTLRELIRIKTRSHYGTMELRRARPDLWQNRGADNGGALRRLARRPTLWPMLAAYLFVKAAARWRATRQMRSARPVKWERDETSRRPAGSVMEASGGEVAAAKGGSHA